MNWNEFCDQVKIKFNKGKEKATDIWNENKDVIIGLGVVSGAVIGGAIMGSKSGKKSMQKEVDEANKARLAADRSTAVALGWLEDELNDREASEHLNKVVHLSDGRNMTLRHLADEVIAKADDDELNRILSR